MLFDEDMNQTITFWALTKLLAQKVMYQNIPKYIVMESNQHSEHL